jgi:hypothetical protein
MAKKKKTDNVAKENLPSPVDAALSMVSFGKPLTPVVTIEELLNSNDVLLEIAQAAAIGASISSIEMKLGFPEGMLKNWLRIGKVDQDGPFFAFFLFFQRASAEAKMHAESKVLSSNPLKWLEMMGLDNQLNVPTQPNTITAKTKSTSLVPKAQETTDSVTGQTFLELDDTPNTPPINPTYVIDPGNDSDDDPSHDDDNQ